MARSEISAPFPDFFPKKFSKRVNPKLISVIFKSDKQKTKQNNAPPYIISSSYNMVYTHLWTNFNVSPAKMCFMVGPFFFQYQVDFRAPLKWRPGQITPLSPISSMTYEQDEYVIMFCYILYVQSLFIYYLQVVRMCLRKLHYVYVQEVEKFSNPFSKLHITRKLIHYEKMTIYL